MRLRDEEGFEKVLQQPPDVVVAIGTTVFRKIRTIKALPVVYTMVMPAETARSQTPNISGVSMDISPEASLAAIGNAFPQAKRIGLVYDPQHTAEFAEEAARAAREKGFELLLKQVRNPSEVPGSLDSLRDRIDVFWMLPDPTVVTKVKNVE